MMIHRTLPLAAFAAAFLALPAQADCTVKYKAKQDNPLRLVAGAASLPDAACGSKAAAAEALAPQLAAEGWTLLAITAILAGN
jgi:hypothetical protein